MHDTVFIKQNYWNKTFDHYINSKDLLLYQQQSNSLKHSFEFGLPPETDDYE